MSVLPEISLDHVQRELVEAQPLIGAMGLELDSSMLNVKDLRFRISGRASKDDELYIAEFRCANYRELPPYVEMIDPDTGVPGTRHAYPKGFHGHPCICARFNRKTYREFSGVHKDWQFGDWAQERATDHLGGMIAHIFNSIEGRLGRQNKGRMA